jgi:hypothetical protein
MRHGHQGGALWNVDVDELNRHLDRGPNTKDGSHRISLELVHERLHDRR